MSVKLAKKPVEQEPDIDQIARDNPDLPREFIVGMMEAKKDVAEGRFTSYEVKSPK